MRLTNKELEIMVVLWGSSTPLTAAEIIESSKNRTWKEKSIYILMNALLEKGAVELTLHKPTMTNTARAYSPTITSEDYMVSSLAALRQSGINVDVRKFAERLLEEEC